jgi:hypothetical protein
MDINDVIVTAIVMGGAILITVAICLTYLAQQHLQQLAKRPVPTLRASGEVVRREDYGDYPD